MNRMGATKAGKDYWAVDVSTLLSIYEELHRQGSYCSATDIEDVINELIKRGYVQVQADKKV